MVLLFRRPCELATGRVNHLPHIVLQSGFEVLREGLGLQFEACLLVSSLCLLYRTIFGQLLFWMCAS